MKKPGVYPCSQVLFDNLPFITRRIRIIYLNLNLLSKFKTIAFWVLVVLGLTGAVWAYFHLRQTKKPSLNAIDVLPDSSACVIGSNSFNELANKLTNQNLIWQELINVSEFRKINNDLNFFDSVIGENETLKNFLEKRIIFLALYPQKTNTSILIDFNLNDEAQATDFLKEVTIAFKGVVSPEGDLEFSFDRANYYLRCKRGVVIISDDKKQIDNAFSEKTKKQNANRDFSGLKKLLDKENLCNVFINHNLLSENKVNLSKNIFSGKSVCDVEFNPDDVTFNGFNTPDSLSVLNTLAGQQAQSCDFLSILPFNIISYQAFGISDYAVWKKQLKISSEAIHTFWKSINDSAMFNVERQLTENISSKIVEAELKYNNQISKSLMIEVKDTAGVNEVLKYISDSVTVFQSVKTGKLKNKDLAKVTFGNVFNITAAYAFVYRNYFIITENKETNNYYINSLVNNSLVMENELFMTYAKDNLNSNFNYQYYCLPNKNTKAIKNTFNFIENEQLKHFDKLSDLSITFSNYKNVLQFRANLKYQQSGKNKDVPGLWIFDADTLIQSKTWTFVNHKSNENELVVQDAKNNLYLINATGNSLWKKQINEAIASDVYTIDAFKNNKFQLLFNTANYLHLIDRNGNYVEGFPVKLPSRATNALAVFDYENTREYRILIACADKTIYNFNANGSKNESFVPIKTKADITLQIAYTKVGASDYLIACDTEGKIYVYSRRGAGRIDLSNKVLEQCKGFFVDAGNNVQNSKITYLDDKNSLLESVSMADKKTAVKLQDEEFEDAIYSFDRIDDDKKTDIMILERSKLKCYDFSGNELFAYENADYTYKTVNYFYDSDGAYFVLSTIGGEVHLVPSATKTISKKIKGTGTPMVYDLFKDGKKYLLVSEDKTLKCVLLK